MYAAESSSNACRDQSRVYTRGDDCTPTAFPYTRVSYGMEYFSVLSVNAMRGVQTPAPGKSQSYRVSYQYWSGSNGKSQSYQDSIQ